MGSVLALDAQEQGEQEWVWAGMQAQLPGMLVLQVWMVLQVWLALQVWLEKPELCEEEELG